jgi:hypothetical protein
MKLIPAARRQLVFASICGEQIKRLKSGPPLESVGRLLKPIFGGVHDVKGFFVQYYIISNHKKFKPAVTNRSR